jgi:hypothetical protein
LAFLFSGAFLNLEKKNHALTLPVRLFCARAFFPLPFSQAKPSPRTAAPNVQARGRFKSEKGEDETKKKRR